MEKGRKYLLTIKRGNNDYLPLEWNLTSFYAGENLCTLEGIDEFTRKLTRVDLLSDVLSKNMIDGEEMFMDYAIIYYEKGKNREVKEGTVFLEDINVLSESMFLMFILDNLEDKKMLSLIYNMCDIKSDSKKLYEFKYVLKNINIFKDRGMNGVIGALSLFKDIEYELKRKILVRLSKRISIQDFFERNISSLTKENDDKVA